MEAAKKPRQKWRESSTLIMVKESDVPTTFDYEVLMLKRTDDTAIFPNTCVYPGGHLDQMDESVEWLRYFEECGVTDQRLKELVVLGDLSQRARILLPQGNGCYDRFFKKSAIWAREISLRINAIRETFEEVGVLICRRIDDLYGPGDYCRIYEDFDKALWQQRVHSNIAEFLNLCRHLKVVPDLWGLHEWSAWASPATMRRGNETAFFITFLKDTPSIQMEASEVNDVMWATPDVYLRSFRNEEIYLFPPQIYESHRFLTVPTFKQLQSFAVERAHKGTTLMLPVHYQCTDGFLGIYPGDDYYVDDPRNSVDPIIVDLTAEEFRKKTKNLHRGEGFHTPNFRLIMNIPPMNGHLRPLERFDVDKSKL